MHECTAISMHTRTVSKGAAYAWLPCCLCALLLSGCARAHATAMPERPPLDVPAPPPREVQAIGIDVPPPAAPPEEPRRTPVPPRPAAPRLDPPKASAAKPDTPPPVEPPKAAEEPPRPPATLQTTPAAAQGEVERSIRATMARATADLNRIDYRALNADARTQYDTAKRFIRQADDAIRAKNLVLAKNLADKASAIAAEQAGR